MKYLYPFLLAFFIGGILNAQESPMLRSELLHHNRVINEKNLVNFNPDWAPFFHGVASGDPLEDRVIIWTRVTPEDMSTDPIEVDWRVATDVDLTNIIQSGTFTTDADRDWTVKVDVTGLDAGTTYYYGFVTMGKTSLTGKTKTTPTGDSADHLKFGVVSCSNYQGGYFNAYGQIAARTDLDAVIHLGDYIYEYGDGVYGVDSLFDDRPVSEEEIVTIDQYRTRYSTYRLDTNLVRAHQQHPFITIWDDHESANDSYTDGAQNHDPATEGDWEERKAVSKQVYFEWMPIRDNADQSVYRTIRYGDLMDLILLDTRLEGREEQIADVTNPELEDPDRTLLGAEQKQWLKDQLTTSGAKWKVVGQQVIFAELNVGWAAIQDPNTTYDETESIFLDIWDGYPAERAELITFVDTSEIDNVVVLTGDFHSSFAFDVPLDPIDVAFFPVPGIGTLPFYSSPTYNPVTGEGSVLVEFATPSITSANFDENVGLATALSFQDQINVNIEVVPDVLELGNPNSHMKSVDLTQHGYYVLDVKEDSTQANWYFTPITEVTDNETFFEAWFAKDGDNHLQAGTESAPKAEQDIPAPADPPELINQTEEVVPANFTILSLYPNPFIDVTTLHYALNEKAKVQINLYQTNGQLVKQLLDQELPAGLYTLRTEGSGLASGAYFYRIRINDQVKTIKVIRK
jgi:alkaline phosphatase D